MNCPIDNSTLLISDRQNVEIDYCPKCRGVWLDRGELDKIIEKSESLSSQQPAHKNDLRHETRDYSQRDKNYYNKKRRESFLGDLFDF